MSTIGLIGTTGLDEEAIITNARERVVHTRYGDVPIRVGTWNGNEVILVRRAGMAHPLEPARVNYRAYVSAMRELSVEILFSTCVVGSLSPDIPPGSLVSLDQFLDFTKHRPPTLFDEHGFAFTDMTEPYCPRVRKTVESAADSLEDELLRTGCYVGVDGPRYETAAEVRMYGHLGGDVIGHTGIPEVIMAREAGLCYGCVALVANYAAGITNTLVSNDEVEALRQRHAQRIEAVLTGALRLLDKAEHVDCSCRSGIGTLQIPPWVPAYTTSQG